MRTDISKLVQAVNRVGISNVSLLSRMTGMPNETVRYVLKRRFPDLGLTVGVHLDYPKLGLEQYYANVKLSKSSRGAAARVLQKFSEVGLLTYSCGSLMDNDYTALFTVPVAESEKFQFFVREATESKIFEQVRLNRLDWARQCELKSKYYNFSSGVWNIDWKRVAADDEPVPSLAGKTEPTATPDVDLMDLLILKEFQLNAWRNVAEIARKLGTNERTLRWHHKRHVLPLISAYYVRWVPGPSISLPRVMGAVSEFNGLSNSQLAKVRALFNSLPFGWYEAGNYEGYYLAQFAVPPEHASDTMRFLKTGLENLVPSWETRLLDLSSGHTYTLPYQNFRKEGAWAFDPERALDAILAVAKAKQ